MTQTVSNLRPFHETIVEAIRVCGPASSGRIFILTRLIRDTAIPKGHDQILAAIDEYFDFPGSTKYARDIREVKESLLAQKAAVHAKPDTGKLDTLNSQVTAAIFKASHLPGGSEEAKRAWIEVSAIESEIAKLTKRDEPEGGIARRGAVTAAFRGGNTELAKEILTDYIGRNDIDVLSVYELTYLLVEARVAK